MEFPIRTGCFLPRHVLREIQREAHERGIITSDLLTARAHITEAWTPDLEVTVYEFEVLKPET